LFYKNKLSVYYREHLYGLIDDKTFKNEMTVFRIDKESELIEVEHRSELMPFIMRYGLFFNTVLWSAWEDLYLQSMLCFCFQDCVQQDVYKNRRIWAPTTLPSVTIPCWLSWEWNVSFHWDGI